MTNRRRHVKFRISGNSKFQVPTNKYSEKSSTSKREFTILFSMFYIDAQFYFDE